MGRRGVTLGTTLLISVLVAMLGLCLASASLGHLHLVSGNDRSTAALDLARSAMATAIARLQSGHDDPEVRLSDARGEGLLSFGPQADDWGIPRSLDNLKGDGSVPGLGSRPLPAYSSQLVAVGRSQGMERRVQALVHLPVFPYAAASEGPMVAPRAFLVGRADPAGQVWPASLRTNADLSLGSGSHVFGDVVASGDIQATASRVDGMVRPHQPDEALARLDLSRFDPVVIGQPSNSLIPIMRGGNLSGVNRASSGLSVLGDLTLQEALVFVQGDVVVRGTLQGKGLLVATGDLTVTGHAQLTGETRLGLAAGGKLSVLGQDRQRSVLKGTLYANQGLHLEQVSVYGVVANLGSQPAEFDSSAVYYDEQQALAQISLSTGSPDMVTVYFYEGGLVSETTLAGPRLVADAQIQRTGADVFQFVTWNEYTRDGQGVMTVLSRPTGPLSGAATFIADNLAGDGFLRESVEPRLFAIFGPPGSEGTPPLELKLDPSELLPRADRFRVSLWEEP